MRADSAGSDGSFAGHGKRQVRLFGPLGTSRAKNTQFNVLRQNRHHVLRFLCEDVGKRLDEVLDAMVADWSKGEAAMEQFDRITTNVARMNGEPCIRDLRLTVRRVLAALATYPDRTELKREYPELEDEDIRQALAFAAALVDDKVVPLTQTR